MRHSGWLFAIAIAILAIQVGKNTNSATPSVSPLSMDTMNIDKNTPVMVINNPS